MRKPLCISMLFLVIFSASAQQKNVLEQFKNITLRSIGPAVTSGRVTSIDVVDGDENTIYVGTASGGLWKSVDGGVTFDPLFDDQDVSGIGAVCIDPSNPDIIWAGTGEGNPRNSQTSGKGIYRSPDAGRSWTKMGLEKTTTIHRVIVDPTNSDVIYAGAHGSAWGPTPDRGVYKSKDGGVSWDKILFADDTTGCADLVMDPQNPRKLFAALYHHYRKPWYFTSGGKGSGLHMTVDGGKTWTKLTDKNGLPEGELGRIGLAIAPSNPKIVYALLESSKTGLYKSTDGGFNWELMNSEKVGDRPFYYHELYVDPKNENHLIYLHSTVTESIDGGKTWNTLLPYYGVHPDHHAFWWSKSNPDFMLEGNDGGLNISRDGGRNWTFASNLPLGQFYHINYDMDTPYHVYGGMQDNGSWKGVGYVWHGGGIRNEDWQEVLFGDGFDVVPYADDSRYVYAMSQGGELNRIDSESGESQYVKPTHPTGEKLRCNWNAGISADPFDAEGFYFGSQYLHYSRDGGMSWKIISPDLTTNDPEKQKQATTGGLTIDNTAAETHCTILTVAPSPLDKNVIWVGTDDGNIQLTKNGGESWMNCAQFIPSMPKNGWVPQIVAGNFEAGEAFVVVNNYRQNDWKPYLFYTRDFGLTWKSLADNNKVSGHCLSVVQDPIASKLLFLGTEHGLYISFDMGTTWNKWTYDYPSVPTQDLKIHPREHDLIIGTFGRAAWIMDNISPLREFALKGNAMTDKKLVALHTPDAYQANYIQPKGQRFPADAHYSGDNKDGAVQLTYYFKIDEEKKEEVKSDSKTKKDEKPKVDAKKEEKKEDVKVDKKEEKPKDKKVTIWIMNLKGDTLRTLKHEPDSGVNIVSWNFDTKGFDFPQRRERKVEEDERGSGISVLPGSYKAVYKFNEFKDSMNFNVKADPRVKWNDASYSKQADLYKEFSTMVKLADDGMEQLKSALKTIELVNTSFANVEDSLKKDVISQSDSLTKRIKELQELYNLPEETPGIQDEAHLLLSKLYTCYGYIFTGSIAPGENSDNALKLTGTEVRKVADKINSFFENDWAKWQTNVEKVQVKMFKERKKL
ncbi:MAG: hypothetical protein ACKVOK_05595 [Flavobacteriales bacterium]